MMIAVAATPADSWTAVQLVTLVVAALTPLATIVGLILVARSSRRQEQLQWANQTVVTHRVEIFMRMAPGLNELLCFAVFVGDWKEIDPRKAIVIKRDLDQIMYAYRALFSDELFAAYHNFMSTLFNMFATFGDAKVRAPIESKWGNRRNLRWWHDEMTGLFTEDPVRLEEIQAAYDDLHQRFRGKMYVALEANVG
jgi:hypothetical protein